MALFTISVFTMLRVLHRRTVGWVQGQFEMDYWGLSYGPALEWILANDRRESITVYGSSRTIRAAADTLPLSDWNRLWFVDPNEADYLLDTFRDHDYRPRFASDRAEHSVDVRFSVRYSGDMKSCSITNLRTNAYVIVGEVELSGEEVLLTSRGRAIAKVVPLEEEGVLKPSFIAEVQRRSKKDTLVPAEKVFQRLW